MDDSEKVSIVEEIGALSTRRPFLPHTIVMISGSRYRITEDDTVSVGKAVIVVVPRGGGQHMLDPYHISELTIEEPAS